MVRENSPAKTDINIPEAGAGVRLLAKAKPSIQTAPSTAALFPQTCQMGPARLPIPAAKSIKDNGQQVIFMAGDWQLIPTV